MELWSETVGDGPALVFLHAAIADSRMWEQQVEAFRMTHRCVRCDFRGFGRTGLTAGMFAHARDVLAVLDRHAIDEAVIVGASMGGRVAMELAITAPERVRGLVLVAAGLPGYQWSDAVRAFGDAEDDAIERGDIDTAVDLNLSFWLDGPSRPAANVDTTTRALVADMQRTALHHFLPHLGNADESLAVPDLSDRLAEIDVPTLVIVGDQDTFDLITIATRLAADIPDAQLHMISDTAHLPSLEAPVAFDSLLSEFLSKLSRAL
ncbi:MAG: alpha/beta fold hydrolase [Ilumatobacteraceae bacterium]